MNFSHFFIRRPILAAVLSIVIVLVGLIAMYQLPIAQYPEIAPPTVVVRAVYPGANPKVLAETVATPIEQEVNGVENMLYMSSTSTSDGVVTLTITFKLGTDLNTAQVLVQNRVAIALPKLPEEVRRLGVTTTKRSPDLTMVVHLASPDNSRDELYVANYAFLQVKDQLARIAGVGDVIVFGARDYSMRVWLDPERLASRNMTAGDLVRAVREQNLQVAAGAIGQPPVPAGNDFQLTISTQGRLFDEQQFGEIIVKQGAQGQVTRVRDVARVELAARDYSIASQLNGKPAAAMVIFQLPGSNAIDTSDRVRAKMEELKRNFPQGVDYRIVYDTTIFARESIRAVVHTLFEAVLLVVLVVIVFLQSWRASIIPLLAVPVSLIGTLAVMKPLGFSLNNLSLFGLVLAIGIVVDDAIVVVENVERNIALGLAPVEATKKAMNEVSGPVIAVALVLSAVFVPTAFISGITGQFYRQFALTIAVSTLISAFNSLTLSPALSAILLQSHHARKDWFAAGMDRVFGWFFRLFNKGFERTTHGYTRAVGGTIRRGAIALGVYAGLLLLTWGGFKIVPTGFIPTQDQGYLIVFAQLPEGASLERAQKIITRAGEIARTVPGIRNTVEFPGYNLLVGANLPNAGTMFVGLDEFSRRKDPRQAAPSLIAQLNARYAELGDARVVVLSPPPVRGLGSTAGFKMMIQDRADVGLETLAGTSFRMMVNGSQTPGLAQVFTTFTTRVPQIFVNVDRVKAKSMNVALADVNDTLQIYLGSLYVNDFNRFGRTYQVTAQADANFRLRAEDISRLKTRNAAGDMVPLGTLVDVHEITGPDKVIRYNMYPAADINGVAMPGVSSGQAIALAQQLAAKELPPGMNYEWTDLTYQEILAGNTIVFILPLCVVLVFLTLAAQYESWSLPLAIILIVPMCLLSAVSGVWLRGMDNNIFTQIGLIVLIGLASKNAILIVEFARQLEDTGKSIVDAAVEAARLRLRPILMTSFAFILGVVPLVLAAGAGAEMRRALGTAVFSGMLGVTFFGLFLTPVFYVVIRKLTARLRPASQSAAGTVIGPMLTSLTAGLLFLSGCAVGPNYKPPQTTVGSSFANAPTNATAEDATALATWWKGFDSATLDRIVERAMANNHDLRIATANLKEARALRRLTTFDLVPTVQANAGYANSLLSRAAAPPGTPRDAREVELYDASFDAMWELDFFGRVRRSVQAANAQVSSIEATRLDVLVTIIAETARNYFELRGLQNQLAVARKNADVQTETLKITQARLDGGRGTDFDVSRSRSLLNLTLSSIPLLEAAIQKSIYRLAVLTGQQPTALTSDLNNAEPLPTTLPAIAAGDPAALLRRRPDIRAAERSLAAATARIGVATADLFPRVTFIGSIGLQAETFAGLGKGGADTWNFGPRITWAALDLGRVQARIKAADARSEASLAFYERTVLMALEETEGALVDFGKEQSRQQFLEISAAASQKAADLAHQRYEGGITDFLSVLDAERTLLEAQDRLAASQTRTVTALVTVYKALGGSVPADEAKR